jgi:hypothetical protein
LEAIYFLGPFITPNLSMIFPPANRVATPFLTQTHKRVDFVNCQAHGKNINSSQKTFENPAIFSKNFGRHSPKKNFLGRGGS